jgi:hypothetical protein
MDFRAASRHQPAGTDFWWPEPDFVQRTAWRRPGQAQELRPALMQHRSQTPSPHERPPRRGGGAAQGGQSAQGRQSAKGRKSAQPPEPDGRSRTDSDTGSYRTPSDPLRQYPRRGRPVPDGAKRPPAAGTGGLKQPQSTALALAGTTPLTTVGVSVVLAGACVLGGLLDLLLVSTAAWAITGLFLAASVYAAMKVHRSHWYSAVVGPPLAFATGLLFVAQFSPERTGPGFMGTVTTILALLAIKARAAFAGTALGLGIVLARRLPFNG